ncbi:MAG: MFS transporter [Inquilinaceae bacterium]
MKNAAPTSRGNAGTGPSRIVLTVFLPFAGGYFLSYVYRSANAVLSPRLAADMGLTPADLGVLTAAYFLAFALFQVPLGLLLDRYGPRRIQSVLLTVAALGAAIFAMAPDTSTLGAGRAVIGLGVSGCLMASFKAITQWFPKQRWPLVNGCLMGFGGLGAIAATAPMEALLGYVDWRGIFLGLAAATLAMGATIFMVVPEPAARGRPIPLKDLAISLRRIYGDRLFWRLTPFLVAAQALSFSLQTLWAAPWLRDVAGLGPDEVALRLFVVALAMTVGFVGTGITAHALMRIGVPLLIITLGGVGGFGIALTLIVTQIVPVDALWPWAVFGLLSNVTVLAYPLLSAHFPIDYSGRANTALNLLTFSGAFVAQSAMGAIVEFWTPLSGGRYPAIAYQAAFGLFLGLMAAGLVWFLLSGRNGHRPASSPSHHSGGSVS